MVTDEFLLHKYVGAGDARAFGELVRRYAGLVYGTCLRILSNAEYAADVAQECFVELARNAGTVRCSLPGWLHRVARSRSLNAIRNESTRRRYETQAASEAIPHAEPMWKDVALCLDEAVNALPDDLRSAIILHYFQGLSQSEVARELQLSQSTVSRRMDKGLDELREQLKKAGIVASTAVLAALIVSNRASAVPATLAEQLNGIALTQPAQSGNMLTRMMATVAGKAVVVAVIAGMIGVAFLLSSHMINRGGIQMDPRKIPGVASALGGGEHTAKMAVEDFPPVPPTRGDGFLLCLSAVLSERGVTVSHDEMLGLSGAAFRVQFWINNWCPSSTDLLGGFEHHAPLLQALGFEHKLYKDEDGAPSSDPTWHDAIVCNIDAGWPVIASTWEESCQYGVITGYVDGGKRWIGRRLGDMSPAYAVSIYVPINVLIIGKRTEPMETRAALRRSLEIALELANTKSYDRGGPQASGFAAYDAWVAALTKLSLSGNIEKDEAIADANHQIYTALIEARAAAANYLAKHAADLGPDAEPHALRAAELYKQIATKLEAGMANLPEALTIDSDGTKHYGVAHWTPEMRRGEVAVIKDVVLVEHKAIVEIEQVLEHSR